MKVSNTSEWFGKDATTLLTEIQAAKILNLTKRALQSWRVQGKGPRFIKLGALVRYRQEDLLAFVEANAKNSTSDV